MQYSDFVKQKMAEMTGSNIKASEKMKKIGEEWRGMKAGFGKSRAQAREETDIEKMVKLLGGKKSKAAGTKIIKAVRKMKETGFEKSRAQSDDKSVKSSEMSQLVQEIKQIEETPKEDHHSSMSHHHGLGF
jgi:hypothetical protein